jgi:hypothetical protein
MSLRDYFAAAALQGMLAHEGPILRIGWDDHDVAVTAYSLADAMLSTRAYVDS